MRAAIYAAKDIVLLDDVLSSLDAKVARHVFDHAICGLLGSTTRILVTNQVCNHKNTSLIVETAFMMAAAACRRPS